MAASRDLLFAFPVRPAVRDGPRGVSCHLVHVGGRAKDELQSGDIQEVVLVARITGVIAAIIWFIGAPLVALAGVPFPSDAQYFVEGAIGVLLGLALVPVMLAIGNQIPSRTKTFVRVSGLVVCLALIVSGVGLILAVQGLLGERAPRLIPDSAIVVFVALFAPWRPTRVFPLVPSQPLAEDWKMI